MSVTRTILFRLVTSARLEAAVRSTPLGERLAWHCWPVSRTWPGAAWPTGSGRRRRPTSFLRLAQRLAETGAPFALATHDGVLREALLASVGPRPVEQLLGVRPAALGELAGRGIPVRVYVPAARPFGARLTRGTLTGFVAAAVF
jgi:hypothetical protein